MRLSEMDHQTLLTVAVQLAEVLYDEEPNLSCEFHAEPFNDSGEPWKPGDTPAEWCGCETWVPVIKALHAAGYETQRELMNRHLEAARSAPSDSGDKP